MRLLYSLAIFLLTQCLAKAQETNSTLGSTFIVGISFHAVSTPFHKPGNNFRNIGFKIGSEVPWNNSGSVRQAFEMGFYFNRFNGKSLYFHSDFAYRPKIAEGLRADIRLGPGIGFVLRPSVGYKIKDGEWSSIRSGKWFPQIHTAIGLSYDKPSENGWRAIPFAQYEIMGIVNYNTGIPVLPNSIIHIGSQFKF